MVARLLAMDWVTRHTELARMRQDTGDWYHDILEKLAPDEALHGRRTAQRILLSDEWPLIPMQNKIPHQTNLCKWFCPTCKNHD
jgi:hypothetical protein